MDAQSASGSIPLPTVEAQIGALLIKELAPHLGKVAASVRQTRSAGWGIVLAIGIGMGVGYTQFQRSLDLQQTRHDAQVERDKEQDERHEALLKEMSKQGDVIERLAERAEGDAKIKAEINRQARAINEAFEKLYKGRARPVRLPFPDVITHATD